MGILRKGSYSSYRWDDDDDDLVIEVGDIYYPGPYNIKQRELVECTQWKEGCKSKGQLMMGGWLIRMTSIKTG